MEKLEALKMSSMRPRSNILDRPLSKGKTEVSQSIVALLFSEIVQYSQSRVFTVPELQTRLGFIKFKTYVVLTSTKNPKSLSYDSPLVILV